MRKPLTFAAAVGLLLVSALPALAAPGDPGVVMVMKHACTEKPIKTEAAFAKVEAKAKGDDVVALALTVLACPAIVLPADASAQTDGIHGAAVEFGFSVKDADGNSQTLADATFVPAKLCETDADRDIDGDGTKSADVCLDISHYEFRNLPAGEIRVKETSSPNGWKFGTLRLTPQALQMPGSDDAATSAAFDASTSTVTLDLSGDADNTAMLHIYNFEDSPATDTLPAAVVSPSPLLPMAAGIALIAGLGLALRRRAA